MTRLFCSLVLCAGLAAGTTLAGGLGVSGETRDRFIEEARAIASQTPSDGRLVPIITPDEQSLIDIEPALQQAWRTDPEATLDLIRRIIEAAEQQ